jgi:hypothetical protein
MPSIPLPARQRRPADAAFIARRLAAIDWREPPSPRARLVETCRAELEWAVAEWRWLASDPDDRARGRDWGPHPSESWRLPHERAAARVVNCHLHLDVAQARLGQLVPNLRRQRASARRTNQDAIHRLYWADAAVGTERDVREYLVRRRLAWRCFLVACADYRRLKALIGKDDFHLAA